MYNPSARPLSLLLIISALALSATQPWSKKPPDQWSSNDIERLLNDSPWAQEASAGFSKDLQDDETAPVPIPAPAHTGMAGPDAIADGRWDGGIGRNKRGGVPTLPVLVRWDSALPIREAIARSHPSSQPPTDKTVKGYIITVLGLVPASHETSTSPDMKETLQGLIRTSRLIPRDRPPIGAEDAKLDPTGALHLFFPRTQPITVSDKEVTVATRYGSMTVEKKFRLKDMRYQGKLEL